MKVIIAGSQSITDYHEVVKAVEDSQFNITTIISGRCPHGVDALGERWAEEHSLPIEKYPAQWRLYGKSAGYMRNKTMAHNADGLVLIWDGKSPGSKNMLKEARSLKLKIWIHYVKERPDVLEPEPFWS